MKIKHFFWIFSLFLASQSFSQNFEQDLHQIILKEKQNKTLISPQLDSAKTDYDITYQRLEWNIDDPTRNYIEGSITTYFHPLVNNYKTIKFDLLDNMNIKSIRYHQNEITDFTHENDILSITLPQTINKNIPDSITVTYNGNPKSTGFDSFVTTEIHNRHILWTLSEPYGAKTWWPCKQTLVDKTDSLDIFVTTPNEYKVGSNGVLISRKPAGNEKVIHHWKHRYPIAAYLVAITVYPYAEFIDYVKIPNGDSITILIYVFPEDSSKVRSKAAKTVDIMTLYNELFGVYPFADEKYGHVQFGWGGGMEHQTMSSMVNFNFGLIAHELAHQWFGDKITCSSWNDIWLNEGFATYLTGLCYEKIYDNKYAWENWKKNKVNYITSKKGGSTYVENTSDVNRVFSSRLTYAKGAYILHMLRWKLGDANFFQAIRNYLNDPKLAFSYAKTEDLKRHLEQQSNLDLTEFFKDWLYGEGYPSYRIDYSPIKKSIKLKISQKTSNNNVDFFEMPVPVKITGEGKDTTLVLNHQFSGEVFVVDLDFQPDSIYFDPEKWIISANNSVNLVTSNKEIEKLFPDFMVYPNPTNSKITVKIINKLFNQSDSIEIVNLNGKKITELHPIVAPTVTFDLSNQPAGTYIIQFYTKEKVYTKKFIKR